MSAFFALSDFPQVVWQHSCITENHAPRRHHLPASHHHNQLLRIAIVIDSPVL